MINSYIQNIILLLFFSLSFADCIYSIGDFNDDNNLNIIDIIGLVNNIVDEADFEAEFDLNFDLTVNIADVIVLINRIVDIYPQSINIETVDFDFNNLSVSWQESSDYAFASYELNYFNLITQESEVIYSTSNIDSVSILLSDFNLKEQNWFYISVIDFFGCETQGPQYYYELPYKHYDVDEYGNVYNSEISLDDFQSSSECQSCHETHYQEWTNSMHSYSMESPIFFSYKNKTMEDHPEVGDKFCSQCHNPAAYLTNTNLESYDSVESFQMSDLNNVLKESIGCDICHTATGLSQTVFTTESGAANAIYKLYPGENIKFGPIDNPTENNFHDSYYLPTYKSSNMCLPCHDLVVDNLETEITFTEWNRIPGFSMFGGVSCQSCHMPEKEDGTHDHSFIGVDLDLNIPYLNNPEYEKVLSMMNSAVNLEFSVWGNQLPNAINQGDTLIIPITIESLTAHNIPSGTSFNRDVWLELAVFNNEQIFYSSGYINNNSDYLNYSDDNLLAFKTYLLNADGDTTRSVIDADNIINNSLAPYSQRFKQYSVFIPDTLYGELQIQARMLFRPFDPEFILEHHSEFIDNLPVFEMAIINSTVQINQ